MIKAESKQSLLYIINHFVFITFLLGIVDLFLFKKISDFSVEEIFLYRFGIFNTSISTYVIILLLSLGISVGILSYLVYSLVRKLFNRDVYSYLSFFSMLFLCIVLIVLRALVSKGFSNIAKYYFPVFIVLIIFLHSLFLILRRNFFVQGVKRPLKSLMPVFFIFFVFTVLFLPNIAATYQKFRFSLDKGGTENPNILLIVLDTVRADSLSCYQEGEKTTPNIDNIAREGILFLKAISPGPWVLPAHASIFTGLYPSQHGADWEYKYLDDEFCTLAEYLKSVGYKTAGMSENPFAGKNRGLAQGFQDFYEMFVYSRQAITPRLIDKVRTKIFNYKKTREYTQDTVRFFKQWFYKNYALTNKPFFVFLNFMPAHLPNYPRSDFPFIKASDEELSKIEPVNQMPEKFYLPQYELDENELNIMRELYKGDTAYLDAELGNLFDFLKATNILDNTILIITSNHGENFGDHGLIEHQFCLYNTLLHVPLIIRYPDKIKSGSVNQELVSTIFLFQTILDLINSSEDKIYEHMDRRSLVRSNKNEYIYAEYCSPGERLKEVLKEEAPEDFNFERFDRYLKCLYAGSYKYIWSSDNKNELFDINNDWNEEKNLIQEDKSQADFLHAKLKTWYTSLWKPPITREKKKLDKMTEEALKSLSYIK